VRSRCARTPCKQHCNSWPGDHSSAHPQGMLQPLLTVTRHCISSTAGPCCCDTPTTAVTLLPPDAPACHHSPLHPQPPVISSPLTHTLLLASPCRWTAAAVTPCPASPPPPARPCTATASLALAGPGSCRRRSGTPRWADWPDCSRLPGLCLAGLCWVVLGLARLG
jgi:hypothetical protein